MNKRKIHCFYRCSYWTTDHQKIEQHYYSKHYTAWERLMVDNYWKEKKLTKYEKN